MFTGVPVSMSIDPACAENASGIMSCDVGTPVAQRHGHPVATTASGTRLLRNATIATPRIARVAASGDVPAALGWDREGLERKYRSDLDSDIADIANLGGRLAGTTTAALFLEHFVGETPWARPRGRTLTSRAPCSPSRAIRGAARAPQASAPASSCTPPPPTPPDPRPPDLHAG